MCTSKTERKIEILTRGTSPSAELRRRAHPLDGRDAAVARGDDEAVAQRRHSRRIAEEVGDPGGDQRQTQASGGHNQNSTSVTTAAIARNL